MCRSALPTPRTIHPTDDSADLTTPTLVALARVSEPGCLASSLPWQQYLGPFSFLAALVAVAYSSCCYYGPHCSSEPISVLPFQRFCTDGSHLLTVLLWNTWWNPWTRMRTGWKKVPAASKLSISGSCEKNTSLRIGCALLTEALFRDPLLRRPSDILWMKALHSATFLRDSRAKRCCGTLLAGHLFKCCVSKSCVWQSCV